VPGEVRLAAVHGCDAVGLCGGARSCCGRVEDAGLLQCLVRDDMTHFSVAARAPAAFGMDRVVEPGLGDPYVVMAADTPLVGHLCGFGERERGPAGEVGYDFFERHELVLEMRDLAGVDVTVHARDVLVRPLGPRGVVRRHLMAGEAAEGRPVGGGRYAYVRQRHHGDHEDSEHHARRDPVRRYPGFDSRHS